jgi:hypothetical protein
VVPVSVALDDVDVLAVPLVASNEMPRLANAFLIAAAKRPTPPVCCDPDVESLVGWNGFEFDDETP